MTRLRGTFCLLIISWTCVALTRAAGSSPASNLVIAVDLLSSGKTISNKFSDLNMWRVDQTWTQTAASWPRGYFEVNFPYVQRVQLMAATGGNVQRDLFKDPEDRSTLTDYDFSRLLKACEGILAKGLKPMVKTGWVPLKFSAHPHLGMFGTNVRPPDDYEAYGNYIRAMCQALKKRFGLRELKHWSWGVGVEYENRDWFEAQDGQPESTKQAFFRLYDYTVAALEDVLGSGNVTVGAHGMVVIEGFWDPCEFIEHCAKGKNFKTGRPGTRLNFVAGSYYTHEPGFDPGTFRREIQTLRHKADELGLTDLKIGIDEGRVLNGRDGLVVYPREVQHPIQAASDAKLFHVMIDENVDYCSTWCLTTAGLFGGVPVVSANLRRLAFRLVGSLSIRAERFGTPANPADEVNCVAGYDERSKTVRVLLYNFNRDRFASENESVRVSLAHVRATRKGPLPMRVWVLDEDHGNWWRAWQADSAERGLTAAAFKASSWTLALPGELTKPDDVQFWNSRQDDYEKIGRLNCTEERLVPGADNEISWRVKLKPHGVVLYEIPFVEKQAL